MPVKKQNKKKYTDKQKAAYYKALARPTPIIGRGVYRAAASKPKSSYRVGASLGMLGGGALGGLLGGPPGAAIGASLGGLAGNWLTGGGAYRVKQNSLMQMSEGESPARMHSSSGNCRIRHREYITDIKASSSTNTFLNQSFPINPGVLTTFPWLAEIASQFQEYVPHGIVFEFKSLIADAIASSTNNTLGGIIMSTNYNSASPSFFNKQQMDNTEYTTSAKPSISFYHPVECAPHENVLPELYIRSGSVPSGQDQKTYDLGNFQIASFGIQGASTVLGELWVSYDIELRKPILTAAAGENVLSDHYQLTGTINATHPLGTTSTLQGGSSIGGTITASTAYNFNPLLNSGNYLMSYYVQGSNAGIVPPVNTYTNCQVVSMLNNDTAGYLYAPDSGVTSTQYLWNAVVQITGYNASVSWGTSGTLPAAITAGDLVVTQMNTNIST